MVSFLSVLKSIAFLGILALKLKMEIRTVKLQDIFGSFSTTVLYHLLRAQHTLLIYGTSQIFGLKATNSSACSLKKQWLLIDREIEDSDRFCFSLGQAGLKPYKRFSQCMETPESFRQFQTIFIHCDHDKGNVTSD